VDSQLPRKLAVRFCAGEGRVQEFGEENLKYSGSLGSGHRLGMHERCTYRQLYMGYHNPYHSGGPKRRFSVRFPDQSH